MTPQQILDSALNRIPVLVFNDVVKQEKLLIDTLRFYSENAGVIESFEATEAEAVKPSHFVTINSCYDSKGHWHAVKVANSTLSISNFDETAAPYQVSYFLDLEQWAMDDAIPSSVESSLMVDLLEAKIGEINAMQLLVTKVVNLDLETKTPQEYRQDIQHLEEQVRMKAVVPDFALF